jgi:hypothetical protein
LRIQLAEVTKLLMRRTKFLALSLTQERKRTILITRKLKIRVFKPLGVV